jgi:hypothetical protein
VSEERERERGRERLSSKIKSRTKKDTCKVVSAKGRRETTKWVEDSLTNKKGQRRR